MGRGGVEPLTKFSKKGGGGLDRTLVFRGVLVRKRGMAFLRRGCNFYVKNKLKFEIFNDKKY